MFIFFYELYYCRLTTNKNKKEKNKRKLGCQSMELEKMAKIEANAELAKEFANLFNEVGNKRNGRAREVANLPNEVSAIKIGESGFIVPLSEGWIRPSQTRKNPAKVKVAVLGTASGIKVILFQKDRLALAKKINGVAPPTSQAGLEKYLNSVFSGLKSVATAEETINEIKKLTGSKPSQ